ncbi:MAG: hypothetical protein K2P84_02160 [Undibacterium sp.]|nr:hypothetical protein [Undibacterium sp.]
MLTVAKQLFSLTLVMSLMACSNFVVSEKNFLNPDVLTGHHFVKTLDQNSVQQVLPNAKLIEERITSGDQIELQGVQVLQTPATISVLYFGGNMFHLDESAPYLFENIGPCPANVAVLTIAVMAEAQVVQVSKI